MNKLQRYKIRFMRRWYGLKVGERLPTFGRGKFADVLKKHGGSVEITAHDSTPMHEPGTFLLTPMKENHGFLVKFTYPDGRSPWTKIVDYDLLYQQLMTTHDARRKRDI